MRLKIAFALLCAASVAAASDVYTISAFVIAPGGVDVSSGTCFSFSGAVGQSVVASSSSANYEIRSGFWAELPATQDSIFSNGFENCGS